MTDKSYAVVAFLFTKLLGSQQDEMVQLLKTGVLFHIRQPCSIPQNFHFNN